MHTKSLINACNLHTGGFALDPENGFAAASIFTKDCRTNCAGLHTYIHTYTYELYTNVVSLKLKLKLKLSNPYAHKTMQIFETI